MKYQVNISPVKSNKGNVLKHLATFFGPKQKGNVEELVENGGIVAKNLDKEQAENIRLPLVFLGVAVHIEEMSSPKPEDSKDPKPDQEDSKDPKPEQEKEMKEKEEDSKDDEKPESNVVSGRVFNSKGIQMPFAPIILVDKKVGKDIQLAKGETEKDGSYKIQYKTKSSTERLDIQVHLVAVQKEKEQILAKSTIRYNAKPVEEELDIVVSVEKLPKSNPEYTRLLTKLKDQLAVKTEAELAKTLAALKEDDDQQDITYLANKTGWDARLVAMIALSHEKSAETELPAPLYYAMYRAAISTGETVLSNINAHTVNKIWKKTIEQNIIDAAWEDQLEKYLDLFKKTSTKIQLNDENSGGVSSMNQMLSLSLQDDNQKQEFAARYFNQNPEDGNFWEGIEEKFGPDLKKQLQLDGKLGVLTLNNAPLIKKLRDQESITKDPIELVRNGFYIISTWEKLIKEYEIPLPKDLPDDTDADKQKIYAASMAQQLKASYPTTVLTVQVNDQEFTLDKADSRAQVAGFLDEYQEAFIIGKQPVTQFIQEKELAIEEPVVHELKRLERLYQMSPSDEAMKILSNTGIDSAHAAVQMGEDVVISKLVSGGLDNAQAQLIYAKSQQVQSTVLNVATAYIAHKNTPWMHGLNSSVKPENEDDNNGVIGYPTLEGLFGEMDFCDCKHCRSVLSPAAYLVDLLNFIDKDPNDFDGRRTGENPLDALRKRRPDIEQIQLTCENTNTVLPYIDLVNEILEYYSVNESLTDFSGYNNTGNRSTEELLANPEFVKKTAYEELKKQVYPLQLPFNQPLATLRRLFDHLDVSLSQAMRLLRANDEKATWENITVDGASTWENIDIEYLEISPEEYNIFTKNKKTIAEYYGEDENVTDLNDFFKKNDTFAKDFSRKVGISYKELTRLVKTRFINPASNLIPKLENLKINIHTILAFINGGDDHSNDTEFDALLSNEFNEEPFGGDVKVWLKERAEIIRNLIFLMDPKEEEDECSFVQLELRRASETPAITDLDYFKFMRFIRFWKKLGWTIEQTDKTITALWPNAKDADTIELLNEGFVTLINRTAHLKRVMVLLNSNPKRDLLKVLGLFGLIDTQAPQSLYKELFLNTSITDKDTVFSANSSVDYLTNANAKILDHEPAVLAAFNLNSEKLQLIVERIMITQNLSDTEQSWSDTEDVPLDMNNATTIHRYAYLSRQLKLSVKELFILQDLSQINPFEILEEVNPVEALTKINPPLIKFIELAQRLKQSSLTLPQLTYYLRHEDLSGEASPSDKELQAIAKQVNDALRQVESDYKAMDDKAEGTVRSKMVLAYEQETVDQFFNIIKNDLSFTEKDIHHGPTLEDELQEITDKLSYNYFQKTLTYKGIMSNEELSNLQNAADVILETDHRTEFLTAIQVIYDKGQTVLQNLFNEYPELEEPYNSFTANQNFEQLLDTILAGFKKRLKKLAVTQTLADALGIEHAVVTTFLNDKSVLHADADSALDNPKNAPAVKDYLALETNGVSAVYFFDDGSEKKETIKNINISPGDLDFPDTPSIKKVTYSFYVEITEKAFYNFNLETNSGADVNIFVNNEEKVVGFTDESWENTEPIELAAHRYHLIEIKITDFTDRVTLKWATENKPTYRLLPNDKLYPKQSIQLFKQSYLRFLKASALQANLEMSQAEIRYFGAAFKIKEAGFLNAIPTHFNPAQTDIHKNLLQVLIQLMDYQQLKEIFDVQDDELIKVLDNPMATHLDSQDKVKSLLLKTTGWSETNLDELLKAFNLERSDLKNIDNFHKIWEAYQLVVISGLPAKILLESTTNSPDPEGKTIQNMEQAIRIKYDKNAWLKVIQPINDVLRNERRDALVAYVLELMQDNGPKTVNTADKLFGYFLIDVEMDSCMKTSRIKQAISTVQLFVQRALLNLEQQKGENFGVDPASINSKQWEWMKRYRVWEANRKVFISPENWLEPELRDNKSPFFKEMESELLQSVITEDQARNVLLGYLEKLDGVAKLDIAGVCLQENQKMEDKEYFEDDDVLHVFGKTQGTASKYYYRRYEGGYFTPWEKVDLDIEGAPILPVIWNDRLFLFWLNIIPKGVNNNESPLKNGTSSSFSSSAEKIEVNGEFLTKKHGLTQSGSNGSSKSKKLIDATLDSSALQGQNKINIEISLSWSEYFNGKWQPRRMSDVDEPVIIPDLESDWFKRK